MKGLHTIAFLFLVIGGINWLLVGVIGKDVGDLFGGQGALASRIIYILVGFAAIVEIVKHKSACKTCEKGGGIKPMNIGS